MKYPTLFQPFQLGDITLKNRLVMSPMTMNYATEEGFATSKLLDYYLERAKGGVGLIVVEGTFFQPEGRGYMNQLGLCSSEHVERLRSMTEAIHELKNDVKIFIQIHHAGWRAYSKITGFKPVGPSEVAPYPGAEIPHALTREEIDVLVQAHVKAAVRAREAGFDGVDIHCAHGYLIPSFFSLLSNQRTDAYGGDLAGRARFLLEIIKGTKEELGKEFPLTIKISGDEFIEGGLGLEEMTQIALLAQGAGIDGMMVSAGSVGGEKVGDLDHLHQVLRTLPMMTERGCLVPLAAEIKKNLQIPVITVGRISTPALAEEILARGKADLVAMGRPLLAEPYLPQKALEGNEALIRPCIACNEGCYKRIFEQLDIRCSVNPTLGREKDVPCPKASNPQKVVVVGAGPAGLQAAHAAGERGHKVILRFYAESKNQGSEWDPYLLLASLDHGTLPFHPLQLCACINRYVVPFESHGKVRFRVRISPIGDLRKDFNQKHIFTLLTQVIGCFAAYQPRSKDQQGFFKSSPTDKHLPGGCSPRHVHTGNLLDLRVGTHSKYDPIWIVFPDYRGRSFTVGDNLHIRTHEPVQQVFSEVFNLLSAGRDRRQIQLAP